MRVTIFCPDRHITYVPEMPDRIGVGGGVTARIRLAAALARMRHDVTLICNIPRDRRIGGVLWRSLDTTAPIEADVLIMNSTGGGLDLRSVLALEVRAAVRLIWLGGATKPGGLDELEHDALVVPSDFVRRIALHDWGVPPTRLFVVPNGVERRLFRRPSRWLSRRDRHRIAYSGHPAKGLAAAIAVFQILRRADRRFSLHIYGDERLWGEAETNRDEVDGIVEHRTVGQSPLVAQLQRAGHALFLQTIPEAFGIAAAEAMAAGCIVQASPAGALPELIRDGVDGFLVPGEPSSPEVHADVAATVLRMVAEPDLARQMREKATRRPYDWESIAAAWDGYCKWQLQGRPLGSLGTKCRCGGGRLDLEDGAHCTVCGEYERQLTEKP
jgi:glycosyltransferase involved in cell wall biosynthesis